MPSAIGSDRSHPALRLATLAAGLVLIGFGLTKFVNHAVEVESFRTYGLPSPDAFVYLIGVIEVVGGAALVTGRGIRLAAPVLAADMLGAIAVSGVGEGEWISLTLAPLLLAIVTWASLDPIPTG